MKQKTMPEPVVFANRSQQSSGFRARDTSPDSAIFTNFSLFSSAYGSTDRCSFASDVPNHDPPLSQVSQHLAGHDLPGDSSNSSEADPDADNSRLHKNGRRSRKVQKAKVRKEDTDASIEDRSEILDSARNSFQAATECQDQLSIPEITLKQQGRRRLASLDLNNQIANATNSLTQYGVMKKSCVMTNQAGTFPIPGTPNYQQACVEIQKGWNPELAPLHNNAKQRHGSVIVLPFTNGRALPSKWEDAERWILSPVSGNGVVKPSFQQPQRRAKSKSGPLGPPGSAYRSLFSPAGPLFEGGNAGNLAVGSPFSAGVTGADGLSFRSGAGSGGAGIYPLRMEPCMARSVSLHGCSELLGQLSLLDSQDEKHDGDMDADTSICHAVSRRDMATQMSPEGSPFSSPGRLCYSPSTPSVLPIVQWESFEPTTEVRDVQVDEQVCVTRWSKKHRTQYTWKGSENVDDWKNKAVEVRSYALEVSEAAKSIAKEEAKITSWENLQKAKAEAAIRNLEMKLDKKRSSKMEKIMRNLRSAQKKAQKMRSSLLSNQSHQANRTAKKIIPFRHTRQMSSLSGCFTCHAF